jgi:hypothetical protein
MFSFSNKAKKIYNKQTKHIIINTDVGLAFEDFVEEHTFQHDITTISYDLTRSDTSSLGQIIFMMSPKTTVYYRSYTKFQSILSYAGGFSKIIFFAAQFIVQIISKDKFYMTVVTSCFSYGEDTDSIKTSNVRLNNFMGNKPNLKHMDKNDSISNKSQKYIFF